MDGNCNGEGGGVHNEVKETGTFFYRSRAPPENAGVRRCLVSRDMSDQDVDASMVVR